MLNSMLLLALIQRGYWDFAHGFDKTQLARKSGIDLLMCAEVSGVRYHLLAKIIIKSNIFMLTTNSTMPSTHLNRYSTRVFNKLLAHQILQLSASIRPFSFPYKPVQPLMN